MRKAINSRELAWRWTLAGALALFVIVPWAVGMYRILLG